MLTYKKNYHFFQYAPLFALFFPRIKSKYQVFRDALKLILQADIYQCFEIYLLVNYYKENAILKEKLSALKPVVMAKLCLFLNLLR